jgi:LEA14-like dessication related protein
VNLLALLGLGFLAYKMYEQSGQLSSALKYSFSGLKVQKKESTLQVLGLQTNMVLTNNTDISANLNGVNGVAYTFIGANKYAIGGYSIPNQFTIPANSSVTVPLTIKLDNVEAAKSIMAIIATLKMPKIQLTGTINTTVGNFPFTYMLEV